MASCYRVCFDLARTNGIATIAFPAISCGLCGYPVGEAATVALRETQAALLARPELARVLFACFTPEVLTAYQNGIATT